MLEATPTTELQAINQMLRTIGELPISMLTEDLDETGPEVSIAIGTFKEVSRDVQMEGWDFNTEECYPLPADTDGNVSVPLNALSTDFKVGRTDVVKPVVRGTRVYDRANHTYVFEKGLEADIIFGLDFNDLPPSARNYITIKACRKFQDTQVGSEVIHRFTENDEFRARAMFVEQHTNDQDLNMLRDTPSFQKIR